MTEIENIFDPESLFGEESPRQIAQMILDEDGDIWNVRESSLIPVVNKVQTVLNDYSLELDNNETWQELKTLYLYGAGYKNESANEKKARWHAYARFRYQLAKQGKLNGNEDLCRDAYF